jgi:hypothetical protein
LPALRTLLTHAIDYAGLFPPAQLDMREAVAEYASHLAGGDAWALGRFVVPATRLEEFEREAAPLLPRAGAGPWRLSALMAPDADPRPIADFNERHARHEQGAAMVDTIEVKANEPAEIAAVGALARSMVAYVEIPVDRDPTPLVEGIRAVGARAKIRTGGTTADAFPPPADVIRFIRACIDAGVPFKATAGLHHPVRAEYRLTYEREAPSGTMYGYLNVFLAAAWMMAGLPDADALALLEERDAGAFDLNGDGVRWRDRELSGAELARARERLVLSFGSCSFREPLDDLAALSLQT